MCDRTKSEVLARNLALEYYRGSRDAATARFDGVNLGDLADENWRQWHTLAKHILTVLDKHDD